MNKLLAVILILLFIFGGSGLAASSMISYLFLNLITFDYTTLFTICTLLTYHFYGLIGMIYVIMTAFTFIFCGIMYWYEMTFEDFNRYSSELHEQIRYEKIRTNENN